MPSFSLKDATVNVNGTDLSSFVRSVTLTIEAEELEDTAMGDDWRSRLGGLKTGSWEVEFNQDFASGAVDQTLFPLLGQVATIQGKPTSATVSATNPQYSGDALVSQYNPFSNAVGEVATVSVTWPTAGPVSRATA